MDVRTRNVLVLAVAAACGGCASILDHFPMLGGKSASGEPVASQPVGSAVAADVHETIQAVKDGGDGRKISSRAVRLPSAPLGGMTAFDYRFPESCGGHQFRVYEAQNLQILEFSFVQADGSTRVIRDYTAGPSPFIHAGLWSVYDHTGDGVGDMSLKYELRSSGFLPGTYSQGPMTGLDEGAKSRLNRAYEAAVRDASGCRRSMGTSAP